MSEHWLYIQRMEWENPMQCHQTNTIAQQRENDFVDHRLIVVIKVKPTQVELETLMVDEMNCLVVRKIV